MVKINRYQRQFLFFGKRGQRRLKRSTALIIGLGGLGSASSYYLIAAGIGRLMLVDDHAVKETDLNRQILHFSGDVGILKVVSAKQKLQRLNPDVRIDTYPIKITNKNIWKLLRKSDVVIDCSDNFETRFLVNESCVKKKIPYIFASADGMKGMMMTVYRSACLRCAFKKAPRTIVPMLGAAVGVLGSLQALEAIKLLTGKGKLLTNKILIMDFERNKIEFLDVKRDRACRICSK